MFWKREISTPPTYGSGTILLLFLFCYHDSVPQTKLADHRLFIMCFVCITTLWTGAFISLSSPHLISSELSILWLVAATVNWVSSQHDPVHRSCDLSHCTLFEWNEVIRSEVSDSLTFHMTSLQIKLGQVKWGQICDMNTPLPSCLQCFMPSVLWRCWLGGRKGIRPVKTEWWDVGVVTCDEVQTCI